MLYLPIENTPEFYAKLSALVIGSLALIVAMYRASVRARGEGAARIAVLGLVIMAIPWVVFDLVALLVP